jgi:hypothetical protein
MDISVIVPTRNRSALLAIALRSVLRQRDVDLEVIVVDEARPTTHPRCSLLSPTAAFASSATTRLPERPPLAIAQLPRRTAIGSPSSMTTTYVRSPLIARRIHQSNSTLDLSEIVRGTQLIEALHHTSEDWGRLHQWFAHSCLRAGRRWAALGHFAQARRPRSPTRSCFRPECYSPTYSHGPHSDIKRSQPR